MYEKNPEDIRFDPKFSNFNYPKTQKEYDGLKALISNNKQTEPILIRNGLCGDGVHRVKIAKELDRQVLCIDVDETMSDKEYILACNKNTIGARNLNSAQKAIRGYKLVKEFEYTDTEAVKYLGMNDRRSIGYARTIADSPYGQDNNILNILDSGESVFIANKWTKSIEVAKRLIKIVEEEQMQQEVSENISEPEIDYNQMIETETGRELFWDKLYLKGSNLQHHIEIIKLINALFKTKKEQ